MKKKQMQHEEKPQATEEEWQFIDGERVGQKQLEFQFQWRNEREYQAEFRERLEREE